MLPARPPWFDSNLRRELEPGFTEKSVSKVASTEEPLPKVTLFLSFSAADRAGCWPTPPSRLAGQRIDPT